MSVSMLYIINVHCRSEPFSYKTFCSVSDSLETLFDDFDLFMLSLPPELEDLCTFFTDSLDYFELRPCLEAPVTSVLKTYIFFYFPMTRQ